MTEPTPAPDSQSRIYRHRDAMRATSVAGSVSTGALVLYLMSQISGQSVLIGDMNKTLADQAVSISALHQVDSDLRRDLDRDRLATDARFVACEQRALALASRLDDVHRKVIDCQDALRRLHAQRGADRTALRRYIAERLKVRDLPTPADEPATATVVPDLSPQPAPSRQEPTP